MFCATAIVQLWSAIAAAQGKSEPMAGMPSMPAPAEGKVSSAEPGNDPMNMRGSLGIPMTREGSGTAWQPDSTPMAALHFTLGDWRFMFHENVFVTVDAQGGQRGDIQINSVNWLMLMARHDLGPGELGLRVMTSLEPLTVGGGGYPLLLQTGESWHGVPLHDHQHPHDLLMEIAAQYTVPLSNDVGVQIYAAPAGEPALGPVAFPHRTSARSDPLGSIGHHWQDSTHIAYGVVTAGVFTRKVKVEGSWFNGREPDENRYGLDLRVPDSFSGRITLNPNDAWSAQASYGYLRSPEERAPDESLHRVTASVTYNSPAFTDGNWATTTVVGMNAPSRGLFTHSSLLETNLDLTRHHTAFGRVELATKTGEDFVLTAERARNRYTVGVLAVGYVYSFGALGGFTPTAGVRGSVNVVDEDLSRFYGSRMPVGGVFFVQIRPADMRMGEDAPGGHTMPM
jgi:hypothetical protein